MDEAARIFENAKLIAKNSAEIAMLMKMFYIILAGIAANIFVTVSNFIQGKRNGKDK